MRVSFRAVTVGVFQSHSSVMETRTAATVVTKSTAPLVSKNSTGWRRKKRGHHLIANILKFHDRIAWKLVNFCNIIC